jgi:competence protein ComFC
MRTEKRNLPQGILELIFPSPCLVCGEPLLGSTDLSKPLCRKCEEGLEYIEDPVCGLCGRPLVSEIGLCLPCRGVDYSFESARSIFAYAGRAKELFRQYKFCSMKRAAPFFSSLLAKRLRNVEYPQIVVPAPFTNSKLRKKGWDQVDLISDILSRRHGIQVMKILRRSESISQKLLDSKERLSNLIGKISVEPGAAVPERLVFLDDVFTTGATANECARALKSAGCAEIRVLTLMMDL